jgi:citrate synthase
MAVESILWLLLTGMVPTVDQTCALARELAEKGEVPSSVEKIIDSSVSQYLSRLVLK